MRSISATASSQSATRMTAPLSRQLAPRDLGPRQSLQMTRHRPFDRGGEVGVVGEEDRLGGRVVLGLR